MVSPLMATNTRNSENTPLFGSFLVAIPVIAVATALMTACEDEYDYGYEGAPYGTHDEYHGHGHDHRYGGYGEEQRETNESYDEEYSSQRENRGGSPMRRHMENRSEFRDRHSPERATRYNQGNDEEYREDSQERYEEQGGYRGYRY